MRDSVGLSFREHGLKAVAVHSGPTSSARATALEELGNGKVQIICSVDMFNEGIDVPSVDTVMMRCHEIGVALRRTKCELLEAEISELGNEFILH